jgi:hypothetical protein
MATTTPNYGWDVPTSTDYVKDGATAIETLGDDIDASLFGITSGKNVGMVHITTATIGTGVTSVPVSNCFSADFDEYMVYIQGFASSTVDALQWQLRDGSGNIGGTQYHYTGLEKINNDTFTSRRAASTSSIRIGTTGSTGGGYYQTLRVSSPFLARDTVIYATSAVADPSSLGIVWNEAAGSHLADISYTGMNIFMSGGGTMTGGSIKIYGMRNS